MNNKDIESIVEKQQKEIQQLKHIVKVMQREIISLQKRVMSVREQSRVTTEGLRRVELKGFKN